MTIACCSVFACADDPVVGDREPPVGTVLTDPADPDADGDGLIDVRAKWTPADDVDPATVRVTALDGVGGAGEGPVDLLDTWRLERLDSTGVAIEETVDALMREGPGRIEVTAADRAGNVWADTLALDLPPMVQHADVAIGMGIPNNADFCDDGRLYVNHGSAIGVYDGRSYQEVKRLEFDFGEEGDVRCIPGQPYVAFGGYSAGVIDTRTVEKRSARSNSLAVAWTALDPGRIYTGSRESTGTFLIIHSILDPADLEVATLDSTYGTVFVDELAISDPARRIFVPRGADGVAVVDFDTRRIVDRLRIQTGPFTTYGLALSPDQTILYAAVTYGIPQGLGIFSVYDDAALRVVETPPGVVPIELDVSPSGKRVFMTATGGFDYLYSVPDGAVLDSLPRLNAGDGGRYNAAVAFSLDGRLLFNAYGFEGSEQAHLQVYLNREARP